MPSTNGHGPKRAILYARVSTDEQARSGYSLAQQLEALREYADREGYEVLEEIADPGQSGASLERPGMDRVRDLVAAGGVSVVLAQEHQRRLEELEQDKDTVLDTYAQMAPEASDALTAEERHRFYKMLRLRVTAYANGPLEISGLLGTEVDVCKTEPTPGCSTSPPRSRRGYPRDRAPLRRARPETPPAGGR